MVQINSNSGPASRKRQNSGCLCLAYLMIGVYIFYYFSSDGEMDDLGTSSSTSMTNKAHKVDEVFVSQREKLLSLVNDPNRINKSTTLKDSSGNQIDPNLIVTDNKTYKFPESGHAHKLLDGLLGVEIGARSYQGFGLTTLNLDYLSSNGSSANIEEKTEGTKSGKDVIKEIYKNEIDHQLELAGIVRHVDVVRSDRDADHLPFEDEALDFVLVNRQSEDDPFTWDPVLSFCEWGRVVKDGGYIYAILPNKEHAFWHREKKSTTVKEVVASHMKHVKSPLDHVNETVLWDDKDATEFLWYMGLNVVDQLPEHDSVQGGYAVVIRVERKNEMVSSRC